MAHREPDMDYLRKSLRRHALKVTPQRVAVHEAMMRLGHASADMVSEDIRSHGGVEVTSASVYNILSQFALLGIYRHRLSANNKMYFDINSFEHAHIYDMENHNFRDLMDEGLMKAVYELVGRRKIKGYKVEGVDVQLLVRPSSRKKKSV